MKIPVLKGRGENRRKQLFSAVLYGPPYLQVDSEHMFCIGHVCGRCGRRWPAWAGFGMAWALFGTRYSTRCDAVQVVSCGPLLVTVDLCLAVPRFVLSRLAPHLDADHRALVLGHSSVARQMA